MPNNEARIITQIVNGEPVSMTEHKTVVLKMREGSFLSLVPAVINFCRCKCGVQIHYNVATFSNEAAEIEAFTKHLNAFALEGEQFSITGCVPAYTVEYRLSPRDQQ